MKSLVRKSIQTLKPYQSARDESEILSIQLDANENPFDAYFQKLNRYPEPQPKELRKALSRLYVVDESKILLTRGSNEGIDLLIRTFCEAKEDNIIICPPTYGIYAVFAAIQGVALKSLALNSSLGFQLDIPGLINICDQNTKLIFLCSPNNPTGNRLSTQAICELCLALKGKAMIVVDEAYIEFSDGLSLSRYLSSYENLIILRTLSKAYGMAGLRLGAVLASAEVISFLTKVIPPYPLPGPVSAMALEGISENRCKEKIIEIDIIKAERESLRQFLLRLPVVEIVYPSEANFILVAFRDPNKIMTLCRKNGIVLRDRSGEAGLKNCIRISIGSPKENTRLKEVLSNA